MKTVFYVTTWSKSTKMQQIELWTKLREAFANWYDITNNEKDESCNILAIRITRATVIKDHGAVRYNMDFMNKVETEEGKII